MDQAYGDNGTFDISRSSAFTAIIRTSTRHMEQVQRTSELAQKGLELTQLLYLAALGAGGSTLVKRSAHCCTTSAAVLVSL